jgi:osmotically-inducible protein OsmY
VFAVFVPLDNRDQDRASGKDIGMSDDMKLQQWVMDELAFEPRVDAAHIGVGVRNGVVTLSGRVGTFAEKFAAEAAASKAWRP